MCLHLVASRVGRSHYHSCANSSGNEGAHNGIAGGLSYPYLTTSSLLMGSHSSVGPLDSFFPTKLKDGRQVGRRLCGHSQAVFSKAAERVNCSCAERSGLSSSDTSFFLLEGRNLYKKVPSETAICSGVVNAITNR